ncbi:Putative major facilitator superfamily, MFS transporter superfamily, nitrate transporter [Septoria linicola]|uniref:Nitrate/nitrite transporter n=1 Tax=Septoria linicola TaxID=215465 RepID=A0A9Q9ER10_9PEZI|nr:putative major facilitator superfamily, MFS transporter superfamily, nitrate transporter [Septoria linicola]USW59402.1 Putative major facilitator superfamily, MFS transporter superfamily, nitrate transporter [Septoria linicola]
MGFNVSLMWRSPDVNPINRKARSIPVLNPVNQYGRVFFFSWFGFLLAFWSWYAFPPLLHDIIKADLKLTQVQVSNSNIVALCATLLVRLIAGPACDRYGPRKTFAGCLLIGAIPTFLAGTAYNVHQLYAVRFFIGILGGSFVPCQVWTTGFYDKNVVGTANALTAGLGNAGGGITYFLMPAIYESLVGDGLSGHVAWRVTFVVPGVIIVAAALALLLLCPDTPTGKWADRMQANENALRQHTVSGAVVDIPGTITPTKEARSRSTSPERPQDTIKDEKKLGETRGVFDENEAQMGEQQMLDTVRGEVIQKPTFSQILRISFSPQTIVLGACYFCTFGGELAINSILGTYYGAQFPRLNLQTSSNWAAMFGLMNVVFRPLGGVVSDFAYKYTGSVWSKKALLHSYCIIAGAFLVAIGMTNQHSLSTLVCLVGIGMAFFLEGANGLNFSAVPHVHPQSNGIVSGFTGACGNLGGIVFAIIFRYNGTNYNRAIWIIGVIIMALNVAVCWIKPVPKGQIGGR